MDENKASFRPDNDDEIITRAIANFNQKDKAVSYAIKEFLTFHQNGLESEENRQILKKIESAEALDAVVQVHRATIALLAAEFRHGLAQKRFEIASSTLGLKIREFEVADEDWELRIHKLLLVKSDRKEEDAAFRKIFEFVKSMAEGTAEIPLHSTRLGHLPDSINRSINVVNKNIKGFLADLANFLLETKVEGQEKILSICEDPGTAKEVAFDQDASGLLRFWASITCYYVHKDS
jgi:hypothetical protein